MSHVSAFAGLDEADRRCLSAWLECVRPSGIDAVLDLSLRPWNVAGARAILGVFESDRPLATWIILRHDDGWQLARPAAGFVSAASGTLAGVLSLIEKPGR